MCRAIVHGDTEISTHPPRDKISPWHDFLQLLAGFLKLRKSWPRITTEWPYSHNSNDCDPRKLREFIRKPREFNRSDSTAILIALIVIQINLNKAVLPLSQLLGEERNLLGMANLIERVDVIAPLDDRAQLVALDSALEMPLRISWYTCRFFSAF